MTIFYWKNSILIIEWKFMETVRNSFLIKLSLYPFSFQINYVKNQKDRISKTISDNIDSQKESLLFINISLFCISFIFLKIFFK